MNVSDKRMMCKRIEILKWEVRFNKAVPALLLVSMFATAISIAAPEPPCHNKFAALIKNLKVATQTLFFRGGQKISICGYKEGYCFENVLPVLEEVEKLNLPGPPAKVLYVSHIQRYHVHVIVEKNGMIFDPHLFATKEGDVTLEGIPVKRYFANSDTQLNSRVLEIPGAEYQRDFEADTTWERYNEYLRTGINLPPGTQRHLTRRYLLQF